MFSVNVLKFATSSPADVSPLKELKAAGYEAEQVLALAATVWEPLLPASAVTIFSGGTEGVLSPHVTFVVKDKGRNGDNTRRSGLCASVGRTRNLEPHEIGTAVHAEVVQTQVAKMMTEAGITAEHVHLVLIKCPLLTSAKIDASRGAGHTVITADTYESMAWSRRACAVGIAAATGELPSGRTLAEAMAHADGQTPVWSTRASCSSGAELEDNHILLLARAPGSMSIEDSHKTPGLHAVTLYMRDAIDAKAISTCLEVAHKAGGEVVQVFAKAEASPNGLVRGKRHTMNTDSDIHSTRHARAAVGGLIAGLTGDTSVYVSGGAEGQGPDGGGSLCVVFRVQDESANK